MFFCSEDETPYKYLQSKLFKLFYCFYQILKIPIMSLLKILIDLWIIKQNMVKTMFVDIFYNAFLAQKC